MNNDNAPMSKLVNGLYDKLEMGLSDNVAAIFNSRQMAVTQRKLKHCPEKSYF